MAALPPAARRSESVLGQEGGYERALGACSSAEFFRAADGILR